MNTQAYVCTDPEILALRGKMAALQRLHDLPVFDFNVRSEIPSRSVLLRACVSLNAILGAFIDGTDDSASNAFCAMVSSYANKIDYSLNYYHRMYPPVSMACRPIIHRIAWYAELAEKPAFTA